MPTSRRRLRHLLSGLALLLAAVPVAGRAGAQAGTEGAPARSTAAASTAQVLRGEVTRVSDGDTLWLRPDGGGKPLKLRLQGIDAPERCQSGGAQAREALRARVLGQRVEATVHARDVYGRLLVTLHLGGTDVAAALVAEGLAWSEGRLDGRREEGAGPGAPRHRAGGPYAAEEDAARAARRGVHAEAGAERPQAFRRRHGPCEA